MGQISNTILAVQARAVTPAPPSLHRNIGNPDTVRDEMRARMTSLSQLPLACRPIFPSVLFHISDLACKGSGQDSVSRTLHQ